MKSIMTFVTAAILLLAGCAPYLQDASNQAIIPPSIKELPMLIYPKYAQQNNFEGKAQVQILVSKEGVALESKLFQSSGYSVLDSAALEYCQKINFNPATVNNDPVNSKTIFTINFDLSDQKSIEKKYISEINDLFDELKTAGETEKINIEDELLFKHKEFLGNVPEGSNPNSTIMKVISNELAEIWKPYRKICSLSFLIYDDFLKRFPDYDDIQSVKNELQKAASNDLKMLENLPISKFTNPNEKYKISLLIRNYIKSHYPDININQVVDQPVNS